MLGCRMLQERELNVGEDPVCSEWLYTYSLQYVIVRLQESKNIEKTKKQ